MNNNTVTKEQIQPAPKRVITPIWDRARKDKVESKLDAKVKTQDLSFRRKLKWDE